MTTRPGISRRTRRSAAALVAFVLPLSIGILPAALPNPEPPLTPASAPGMTGGGSVIAPDGQRITHAFDLHCDVGTTPNDLEIAWEGAHFHLTELSSVECLDDPAVDQMPPKAPFDTLHGVGTGDYNGENGAVAEWTFTDAGDPGLRDRATITIRKAAGDVVLQVSNTLAYGNHQAHQ
jgi:hypothetical protein